MKNKGNFSCSVKCMCGERVYDRLAKCKLCNGQRGLNSRGSNPRGEVVCEGGSFDPSSPTFCKSI
jgi:hypothetical protein